MTPTQRTLRELKRRGLRAAVVEKWNQYAGPKGVRQDLFGIIDIIALDPERGVVGVQSTGTARSTHLQKLLQDRAQETLDWIRTPGAVLELWSWRKAKRKRGGKAEVWQPRIDLITEDMVQ